MLYIVTYSTEKPKTGHKPEVTTRIIEAENSASAMGLMIKKLAHGNLYQIQADYAGQVVLK